MTAYGRLGWLVRAIAVTCGMRRSQRAVRPAGGFSALRVPRVLLACVWVCAAMSAVLPAGAGAFAIPGAEPTAGPPGLPDGRIYEQVSPTNKYGNSAGSLLGELFPFMEVRADGDGVLYSINGPIGETDAGFTTWAVARRSVGEWSSSNALPRPAHGVGPLELSFPKSFGVSSDMSQTLFTSVKAYVWNQKVNETSGVTGFAEGGDPLYLAGASGHPAWSGEAMWLAEAQVADPEEWENGVTAFYTLAGASSDFSTVYFVFPGRMTPGDNAPDPNLEDATRSSKGGMGFFQWKDGVISYAGTLPDGTIDPYGAQYPGLFDCVTRDHTGNQVSVDGSRAFFVSPAPQSEAPPTDPTELYVHKLASDGSTSSVLVSRDTLLPAVGGLPAGSPRPPVNVNLPRDVGEECYDSSYMYASPDGSHVFFESLDRLTSSAPSDESIKEYEFDVTTETLTYLPGVTVGDEQGTSAFLTTNDDGSKFVFAKNTGNPGETLEIDMWSDGPNGPVDGQITPIVAMPSGGAADIGPVKLVADGSVVMFDTNAALDGFNNGGLSQVYRYEADGNTLTCVSCPPAGVAPSGPAYVTHNFTGNELNRLFVSNRGISSDGSRVYFETPEALVPQDVNGYRDVYEWENGTLLLISTGISQEHAYVGDNTPSGDDVIFSTSQNIAHGDVDESYDVYDARIPRPGDYPPPSSLPCSGDVCQGPPSVPTLLGIPTSAPFNGLGNPSPAKPAAVKRKAKKHKAKRHKKHRPRHKQRHGKGHRSISTTKGKG